MISMVFLLVILSTTGFINSLYFLSDYIVYPSNNSSRNYIIITSYSAAPFTAIFDSRIIENKVKKLENIDKIIYEVLTIVEYDNKICVLRGIDSQNLPIITGKYRVIGDAFNDDCINCIWVGAYLAKKLGINPNDTIILYSPFKSSSYIFRVKGFIETKGPLNYEFLTNIDTARIIRGAPKYGASIAIIFPKNKQGMYELAHIFNISTQKKGLLERALLALRISGKNLNIRTYESLSNIYLSRFGLSKDLLFALLLAITTLLSLGFYLVGQSIIIYNIDKFTMLYEQGLSITIIKLYTILLALVLTLLAGLLASLTAYFIFPYIKISILEYETGLVLDKNIMLIAIIVVFLIVSFGILSVKIHEEPK